MYPARLPDATSPRFLIRPVTLPVYGSYFSCRNQPLLASALARLPKMP